MPSSHTFSILLDGRLLRHPRAYHLRRMRMGLWLYLDLLARLPAGADRLEVEPAAVAGDLGVTDGFVRSWLGHLAKAGYLETRRLNGAIEVHFRDGAAPEPGAEKAPAAQKRFFTAAKLSRALDDRANQETFATVLKAHEDPAIRKALAGALAVPENQIRRSRTALFLYLLKNQSHEN